MSEKKKKTFYYIYSDTAKGYYSNYGFESVACPTSYFKRFKSIRGAEREIKGNDMSGICGSTDHLTIETTKQVQARRHENLILYYAELIKKIKKSLTKKEFKRILEA